MEPRNYPQRVSFPSGKQQAFINNCGKQLAINSCELAQIAEVCVRTLNDWKKEKFTISLKALKNLSKASGIPIPGTIQIKDPFWYVEKGSRAGYKTVIKKYGKMQVDPRRRLAGWRSWWETTGKYQPHPIISNRKKIKKPRQSIALAEFTGIMMGDGGITERQIKITSHATDDHDFIAFAKKLIQDLFEVPVAQLNNLGGSQATNLVVSRTDLVDYCHNTLGLPVGHKINHGVDVPSWIHNRTSYEIACLRGLFDTDGCVFHERHRIKNKVYSYPRMCFVSFSAPLLASTFNIFKNLGFSPRIRKKQGQEVCVQLENKEEIRQYFKVVGTRNTKHKNRFLNG